MRKLTLFSVVILAVLFWLWSRRNGLPLSAYRPGPPVAIAQTATSAAKVKGTEEKGASDPIADSSTSLSTDVLRMRELLLRPRAALSVTHQYRDDVSNDCFGFFEKMRGLDLTEITSADSLSSLPSQENCRKLSKRFEHWARRFAEVCEPSKKHSGDPQRRLKECTEAALFYRAEMTDWMTYRIDLPTLRDPQILLDKTIARFATDPPQAARFAERLLELEPRSYFAARMAFLGNFVASQWEKDTSEKEHDARLASSLQRAKDLGPAGNLESSEMEMLAASRRGKAGLQTIAEISDRAATQYPRSGIGPYFQAWMNAKQGNAPAAIELLKLAAQREPAEPRYQEALLRMQSGGGMAVDGFELKFAISTAELFAPPKGK